MCAQVESEVTELILRRDNDHSKRRSERGGVHGGVQATRFRAPRRASAAGGRGKGPERAPRGGWGGFREGEALPGQRLVPLEALGSQVGA